MRDIIWTIIGIWVIYKLVDAFRAITAKRSPVEGHSGPQQQAQTHSQKKDIHSALKKHLNKEGEYVEFEEIK